MTYSGLETALFGYHVSLCAATVVGISLFTAVRRGLPSRRCMRLKMARTHIQSAGSVHELLAEAVTRGDPKPAHETAAATGLEQHVPDPGDRLSMALGSSLRWTLWLRTLRGITCLLVGGGIVLAALQGVFALSTEKASAQWAYLWVINRVISQALWGLPVLAFIYLLHAYCEITLSSCRYHLDRLMAAIILGPR